MSGWRLGARSLPADGEVENGDAFVLRGSPQEALIVVVDALGHGPKAAEAARLAIAFLDAFPWPSSQSVVPLIEGLHEALRGSRGAAALALLLRGAEVEGCGVGNVDLRCVQASLPVTLTPGILGSRMSKLRVIRGRVNPGARLFLFSDGLSSRSPFHELSLAPPEDACAQALRAHRYSRDDATLAAAYYDE
ncbi:MAG: SpoIIE family protein phosphatase [Polyangiaceae bacterium]|nr:SpoIIE family protein phosphatase [Polyangiaceae bacterium]